MFTVESDESGMTYFCRATGNSRTREGASLFGGMFIVNEVEVEKFRIVHPDDVPAGMRTLPVPDWLSSRECGVGASDGVMWVIDK